MNSILSLSNLLFFEHYLSKDLYVFIVSIRFNNKNNLSSYTSHKKTGTNTIL